MSMTFCLIAKESFLYSFVLQYPILLWVRGRIPMYADTYSILLSN